MKMLHKLRLQTSMSGMVAGCTSDTVLLSTLRSSSISTLKYAPAGVLMIMSSYARFSCNPIKPILGVARKSTNSTDSNGSLNLFRLEFDESCVDTGKWIELSTLSGSI